MNKVLVTSGVGCALGRPHEFSTGDYGGRLQQLILCNPKPVIVSPYQPAVVPLSPFATIGWKRSRRGNPRQMPLGQPPGMPAWKLGELT